MEIRSNSLNSVKPNSRMNYGTPQTGNMTSYSGYGINHGQRNDGVNHQTHPDRINHRQRDNFGR